MCDSRPRWVPLESNPDVMTKYIHKLGVPERWHFEDVLGLDEQLLAMVSQPAVALIVLFPKGDKVKSAEEEMCCRIQKEGQVVSDKVYFMKQTIGNACGTIGVLHAVLNNENDGDCKLDGILKDFLEVTKGMNGDERGSSLEANSAICDAHGASAQEGQTQAPSAEESVKPHFIALVHMNGSLYELDGCKPFPVNRGPTTADTFLKAPEAVERVSAHFIALVNVDGVLYELDGRKPFPVNRGETSTENFLKDAAVVCQQIMALDPTEMNFNIMALTSGQ